MKSLGTMLGISTIAGTGINMVVTRVTPKFLILPTWARIPLRFGIFGAPFLVLYPKLSQLYNEGNEMVEEQFIKIQRFRRTGNIEEYFS